MNVKEEIRILNRKIDEINSNQINYKIENDLLEKTYSYNYDRVNLLLTCIIGFFGVLSFLGLRNVNSIKMEYKEELNNLKKVKLDLESKSKELESTKTKYDQEIKDIILQNEEQNRKIKILELKEKINKLYIEKNFSNAYDYCILALELAPSDVQLLLNKARILFKTGKYDDAEIAYKEIIELEPKNTSAVGDLTEILMFRNQKKQADEYIEKYKGFFSSKIDGKLLKIFEMWNLYHEKKSADLMVLINSEIDKSDMQSRKPRHDGWDMGDGIIFLKKEPESDCKKYLICFLAYLDGQLSSEDFFKTTGINV